MTVRVKDNGANALVRTLKDLENVTIRVGILAGKAEKQHDRKSQLMTVDIAGFHEFGAGVPRRSWLRDWADEQSREIDDVMRVVGRLAPKEGITAFYKAALKLASMCRDRVRKRIPPPLAAETIQRKKSSIPLIDTGTLLTSITAEVETKLGKTTVSP